MHLLWGGAFDFPVLSQGEGPNLLSASRVPGVCPRGMVLDKIDTCIRIRCPSHDITDFINFDRFYSRRLISVPFFVTFQIFRH